MLFFVYILKSKNLNTYYIGSTEDLSRRLEEHNRGKGNYTKKGMPWELVYIERYSTRTEALKRERAIKARKSKIFIDKLIEEQKKQADSEHPVL